MPEKIGTLTANCKGMSMAAHDRRIRGSQTAKGVFFFLFPQTSVLLFFSIQLVTQPVQCCGRSWMSWLRMMQDRQYQSERDKKIFILQGDTELHLEAQSKVKQVCLCFSTLTAIGELLHILHTDMDFGLFSCTDLEVIQKKIEAIAGKPRSHL